MTAAIRISHKYAVEILRAIDSVDWGDTHAASFALALDSLRCAVSLKPKRSVVAAKKRKVAKKKTKREETSEIREAVMKRADGRCEHCGQLAERLELDHFFSRRGEQSERTCWAMAPLCHKSKTNWTGSADFWLRLFADHCNLHGYGAEKTRALSRLEFVTTRNSLPASPRYAP
jgi:hypothetical protein